MKKESIKKQKKLRFQESVDPLISVLLSTIASNSIAYNKYERPEYPPSMIGLPEMKKLLREF